MLQLLFFIMVLPILAASFEGKKSNKKIDPIIEKIEEPEEADDELAIGYAPYITGRFDVGYRLHHQEDFQRGPAVIYFNVVASY